MARREEAIAASTSARAHAALGHSDCAYVLETGRIITEGPSKELAVDPGIKEAYLGE
ncbi:MAG: hypothetical protein ACREYF_16075 [Gammaproteobacteria bacterium]